METRLIICFVFLLMMLNGVYANEDIGIMPIDPDPVPIIVTPEVELGYEVMVETDLVRSKSLILGNVVLPVNKEDGIVLSDVEVVKVSDEELSLNLPEQEGIDSIKDIYFPKDIDSVKIKITHGENVIPVELSWISEDVRSDLSENLFFEKKLSSGKIVSIKRTRDDIKLESDGITAYTKEELIIKKSGIYIEEDNEVFEISVLPYGAFEKINDDIYIVNNIELKVEDGAIFYDIEGIKKGFLFGIIPINVNVKVKVNAESGDLYDLKESWWNILVF